MKEAKCFLIRCSGCGVLTDYVYLTEPDQKLVDSHQLVCTSKIDPAKYWVKVTTSVLSSDDTEDFSFMDKLEKPDVIVDEVKGEAEFVVASIGKGTVTDPQVFHDPVPVPPPTQAEIDYQNTVQPADPVEPLPE